MRLSTPKSIRPDLFSNKRNQCKTSFGLRNEQFSKSHANGSILGHQLVKNLNASTMIEDGQRSLSPEEIMVKIDDGNFYNGHTKTVKTPQSNNFSISGQGVGLRFNEEQDSQLQDRLQKKLLLRKNTNVELKPYMASKEYE